MVWDEVYRELKKRNWIILLLLSTLSTFLTNSSITTGIIVGGFIIILNFGALQHTMRRAFPSQSAIRVKSAPLIAKSSIRVLALGASVYFLLKWEVVDPIGLAIGLSTVVLSIVSFGISMVLKNRTGEVS